MGYGDPHSRAKAGIVFCRAVLLVWVLLSEGTIFRQTDQFVEWELFFCDWSAVDTHCRIQDSHFTFCWSILFFSPYQRCENYVLWCWQAIFIPWQPIPGHCNRQLFSALNEAAVWFRKIRSKRIQALKRMSISWILLQFIIESLNLWFSIVRDKTSAEQLKLEEENYRRGGAEQ